MDNKMLNRLMNAAQDGDRVIFTPVGAEKSKILWAGMGNRSGLHSFASVLLLEKFDVGKDLFTKKLHALGAGTVTILVFQNITRDRGKWVPRVKFDSATGALTMLDYDTR
ncbi:MAG: hypothetical protein NUW00_04890 [Candidatus Kaiserbacteria bacterium]|nr:hypothetical protein [Candidatus Kaiserbacteria bacterium]MCR4330913.1 hypothetical protein [Patescibacteria group bacterium]